MTGGAGLAHSGLARTIKRSPIERGLGSRPLITDGPFAESVEQLSGFYLVGCDDYDALADAATVLVSAHPVVEIRPVAED